VRGGPVYRALLVTRSVVRHDDQYGADCSGRVSTLQDSASKSSVAATGSCGFCWWRCCSTAARSPGFPASAASAYLHWIWVLVLHDALPIGVSSC